jgi:hypothetical protein
MIIYIMTRPQCKFKLIHAKLIPKTNKQHCQN